MTNIFLITFEKDGERLQARAPGCIVAEVVSSLQAKGYKVTLKRL